MLSIIFEFEITISAKQEDVIIFTMRPRPVKARCIYTSLFEVTQSTMIGLTDIQAESDRVVESGKSSLASYKSYGWYAL